MSGTLTFAAFILALSLALGLIRVFIGPTLEERMTSVQLAGTTGVGLILVLGSLLDLPANVDIALLFALLAAVSVVALTRRQDMPESGDD